MTIGEAHAKSISEMNRADKQLFLSEVFPQALERLNVIRESCEQLRNGGYCEALISDYVDWAIGIDKGASECIDATEYSHDHCWHGDDLSITDAEEFLKHLDAKLRANNENS